MAWAKELLSFGGFCIYNRCIAQKLGIECAILLGALCDLVDGYGNEFYYQQDRMMEKTALSEYAIRTATQKLVELKFISVERKGLPAKLFYTVNEREIALYFQFFDFDTTSSANPSSSAKSQDKTISNTLYVVPSTPSLIKDTGKESTKSTVLDQRFTEFWTFYPKKIGKGAAENVYRKLKPDDALHKTILAAIVKAKKSAQWTRDGGQYIPNPATWLNQKRWEDELDSGQQPQRDPRLDFFLGGGDDNP